MLKVDRAYVDFIHNAIQLLGVEQDTETAKESLLKTLHQAMRLEASTIPPYYVAAWSVMPSPGYENQLIQDLIAEVSKEEMLHMMAIANIISATGKTPDIATKEIVLDWGKSKLPIGGDLIPSLCPFSMDLLTTLFMEIEKPVNPQHYVVIEQIEMAKRSMEEEYATIGEFYEALIELINSFPEDPFANGGDHPQINISDDPRLGTIDHAPITDFIVKSRTQAIDIINWIVDQGEGSKDGPLDGNGSPAHYYRFAEIYKGGKLVKDDSQPLGYAYNRAKYPINCDFTKVVEFQCNPKMEEFKNMPTHYNGLKAFNEQYKLMFEQLQDFYESGNVQKMKDSLATMKNMGSFVPRLLSLDPPVCPSFEWIED